MGNNTASTHIDRNEDARKLAEFRQVIGKGMTEEPYEGFILFRSERLEAVYWTISTFPPSETDWLRARAVLSPGFTMSDFESDYYPVAYYDRR